MLHIRIITFLAIIVVIYCTTVRLGEETETGFSSMKHRISFPFTSRGKPYYFALTDMNGGKYWFIQEFRDGGKMALLTSHGVWDAYCTKVFPFTMHDKQYVFCISEQNHWFIQELLPSAQLGLETDNGFWTSQPTIIFPFDIGGEHYVYSVTDTKWFIRRLLPHGKMGSETDSGTWINTYTIGFPFSINGRQYFYCVSEKYWFIQELLSGGKMGLETANGHWTTNHLLSVPFSIDNKQYYYGITDADNGFFIQELLPGGKMGPEKTYGAFLYYYPISFLFNIKGRQFLYGISEYYWFIQEVIQEPRVPAVAATMNSYCNNDTLVRKKRQNNNGTYNQRCNGLNAIEEQVTEILNDDYYFTMTFNNPNSPLLSVSTFRVYGDANHDSYIDLTAAMTAEIHYSHMASVRDPSISAEVREHLRQMDRQNDDEAGHLLASSLGGASVPFNFAPQSPMFNRAVYVSGSDVAQPGWFDVEAMLRDYLVEMGGSGYIRWNVVPQYSLLPDSRRPTSFLLSIRFYNDRGELVNWRMEGAVRSYNFPNVPTAACIDRNSPWWNHKYWLKTYKSTDGSSTRRVRVTPSSPCPGSIPPKMVLIRPKHEITVKPKHPLLSPITSFSILSINIPSSNSTASSQESFDSSFFSSDDTLSMISTPWITESDFLKTEHATTTSITINPRTSSSYGCISPNLSTGDGNTITLLRSSTVSYSTPNIHPLFNSNSPSRNTLSSWSVESFTSPVEYSGTNIKVRYPWSPCSFFSETDLYPSTVRSLMSISSSITSPTLESLRETAEFLTQSCNEIVF